VRISSHCSLADSDRDPCLSQRQRLQSKRLQFPDCFPYRGGQPKLTVTSLEQCTCNGRCLPAHRRNRCMSWCWARSRSERHRGRRRRWCALQAVLTRHNNACPVRQSDGFVQRRTRTGLRKEPQQALSRKLIWTCRRSRGVARGYNIFKKSKCASALSNSTP
jgi:hypothetical protein